MKLLRRLYYILRQRRLDSDLAEEIETHRQLRQKELEQSGLSSPEARSASHRALGNSTIAREDARSVWIWPAVEQLVRDVRIGARMLFKTPLFTIFASLVLSIGIGSNVMVFTYLNALFLRPLDVPEPAQLMRIYGDGEGPNGVVSYDTYLQYRDRNQSFANVGMYVAGGPPIPIRMQGPGTLPIDIMQPTTTNARLFDSIRVKPLVGRNIESGDERIGAPTVAMINEAAWKQYFAEDHAVVGRTIFINNTPHTVIGVVTKSFERVFQTFPTASSPKIYLPQRDLERRSNVPTFLVARLKPDVSREQAQADLSRVSGQVSLEKRFHVSVSVEPGNAPPSRLWVALGSVIAFFMVGVFVVLLIACDDIAILLVARIAIRQREMGVRLALGASRFQLIRQLIAENMMLAGLGGVGSIIFALLSARALERLPFLPVPDSPNFTLDWRVLAFTTVTSLATTLFFGLRPALQCVNKDVIASINPGARQDSASFSRMRSNLVVTQIAICTALLITAGLLVRSTAANVPVSRGFTAERVLIGTVNFMGAGYDAARQRSFYTQLLKRLSDAPGIVSVCIVDSLPIALLGGDYFRFGGAMGRYSVRADSGDRDAVVATNIITRGHFETLRIPLLDGRDFEDRDDITSPKVGIINQSMARRLWPNENAVGRTIRGEDGARIEIVGVAGDIRYDPNAASAEPLLYRPLAQTAGRLPNTLMIRTAGEPMSATPLIQTKITEIDPNLLAYNLHTLEERMGRMLIFTRMFAAISGIPGAFALLLGIIGTYGTMALVVAQRRREIGIRIALGAHPSSAVTLITKQGMQWTGLGLGLGIFGAVLIALWLSRNFFGLNFFDPVAFAAMTLLVTATAGLACYLPARRASRLDPMKVLRED